MYSNYLWKFTIVLLIFFSLPFITGMIENGEDIVSSTTTTPASTNMENDVLKEFFAALLQLPSTTVKNDVDVDGTQNKGHGLTAIHPPQYFENLYDRMALDSENDDEQISILRRRRRNVNGRSYNFGDGKEAINLNDGPATIQAISKDDQMDIGDANARSYLLQFNLEKLWIKNQELQMAELVLAVDYSRLTAPPGSYSVYAYSVDDNTDVPMTERARLLVSAGSLGQFDTFDNNFVKLKVTDSVVRQLLAANGQRSIVFEIYVAYKIGNENTNGNGGIGGGAATTIDLNHREIENLFHLKSHGSHQPLLVLYSSTTEGIGEGNLQPSQYTRRRRNTSSASTSTNARKCYGKCCWHEWWVDLAELFRDNIMKPEGYYANYCAGNCLYPMYDAHLNATGNAFLRSGYNAVIRQRNRKHGTNEISYVPEATCVVQSTSPITVSYKVEGNFIIRKLYDMVVKTCQCA